MEDHEERLASFRKNFEALNESDPDELIKGNKATVAYVVQEALKMYEVDGKRESLKLLGDMLKLQANIPDESEMDSLIDLTEAVQSARSKYTSKESDDEQHQDSISNE